jgi:hypothetical protein
MTRLRAVSVPLDGLDIGDPVSRIIEFADGALTPNAIVSREDIVGFTLDFGTIDIDFDSAFGFAFEGLVDATGNGFAEFTMTTSDTFEPPGSFETSGRLLFLDVIGWAAGCRRLHRGGLRRLPPHRRIVRPRSDDRPRGRARPEPVADSSTAGCPARARPARDAVAIAWSEQANQRPTIERTCRRLESARGRAILRACRTPIAETRTRRARTCAGCRTSTAPSRT